MVRAKFRCNDIVRTMGSRRKDDGSYEPAEVNTVKMSPVYGNNDPAHENTKFWAATPSGQVELTCINLEAAKYFEPGKEYYLDFTKAE
jgi:hypothetical protein